jgi:hypothetical protein
MVIDFKVTILLCRSDAKTEFAGCCEKRGGGKPDSGDCRVGGGVQWVVWINIQFDAVLGRCVYI